MEGITVLFGIVRPLIVIGSSNLIISIPSFLSYCLVSLGQWLALALSLCFRYALVFGAVLGFGGDLCVQLPCPASICLGSVSPSPYKVAPHKPRSRQNNCTKAPRFPSPYAAPSRLSFVGSYKEDLAGRSKMSICKVREILWNEAGLLSAAVTQDECNAADGRSGAAC